MALIFCVAFVHVLLTIFTLPSMKLRTCVQVFDKAFKRGLHLQVKKTIQQAIRHRKLASDQQMPNRVTLDSAPMRVFLDDEELEDLVYFIAELLPVPRSNGCCCRDRHRPSRRRSESGIGGARRQDETAARRSTRGRSRIPRISQGYPMFTMGKYSDPARA